MQGTAALETLFSTVGLGWAVNLMELPIVSKLVDVLYEFLSANRISLGNAMVRHTCLPCSPACLNADLVNSEPVITLNTLHGILFDCKVIRPCSLHMQGTTVHMQGTALQALYSYTHAGLSCPLLKAGCMRLC